MAKGDKEAKAVRAQKSLDLRIAGASYREIGKKLQVSEKTAFYDVQHELARLDPVKRDLAERLRDIELARLDRMTAKLGRKMGDHRAVTALVKVMDRRAKLLGLDAPTRLEHTGKDGAPIEHAMKEAKSSLIDKLEKLGVIAAETPT